MRKETAPLATRGTAEVQQQDYSVPPLAREGVTTKPRKPTKWARCLYYLTQRPLFELEALNLYGDTCLHTTISDLNKRFGLLFHREWVTHQHQHGGTTTFMRYTLAPECREQAVALLEPFGLEVAA
jgi:hypothetical protein